MTTTMSSAFTWALRLTACTDVTTASAITEPSLNPIPLGRINRFLAGALKYSAYPPLIPTPRAPLKLVHIVSRFVLQKKHSPHVKKIFGTTLSPILNLVSPSPSFATTPAG